MLAFFFGEFKSKFSSGYQPYVPEEALANLISKTLGIITIIAGVSFLFYFMFGAVNWITSGGDAQKAAAARNTILNAVIGLIITVIAYPAILLISQLIGVPLENPSELFTQLFK